MPQMQLEEGQLTPAYEDYIEAIYELCQKGDGSCRSVDVAESLGFSKASVTRATKNLREGGYIEQERYGLISITPKGEEYGRVIHNRHRALMSFLEDILGVDPQTANAEACKIEHCVSQDTMERWSAWMETCRSCRQRTEQQP